MLIDPDGDATGSLYRSSEYTNATTHPWLQVCYLGGTSGQTGASTNRR
jgi:hypothetical protein